MRSTPSPEGPRTPDAHRPSKKPGAAASRKFRLNASQLGTMFSSSAGFRIRRAKDPPGCCSRRDARVRRVASSHEAACSRAAAESKRAAWSAARGEPCA